jgi:hypothetical protein
MADLIDGTLDELDAHLRQLKRHVATLEAFRRQLELPADDSSLGSNVRDRAVGGDALDSGPRARTGSDR